MSQIKILNFQIMTKNEFIKIGEQIIVKPKGADYDLIPGKVYDLSWNRWEDSPIFKENGELNLPKKVYSTKTDDIFKKRIITYFNKANTNTTGVMLAGTKGTGKTVMAKILAKESGLPIIVVNPDYPEGKLIKFFKSFTTPVCVLFDEVEKNFKTEYMLDFLDGVEKTAQKLVIMTCNDLSRVSQYMQDRCSRIRYLRRYSPDENAAFLPMLADDFGIKNKEEVVKFGAFQYTKSELGFSIGDPYLTAVGNNLILKFKGATNNIKESIKGIKYNLYVNRQSEIKLDSNEKGLIPSMTSNLVKDAINYGDIIYKVDKDNYPYIEIPIPDGVKIGTNNDLYVRYYYEDNGELLMLSINGTTTHRYQVGTGDN